MVSLSVEKKIMYFTWSHSQKLLHNIPDSINPISTFAYLKVEIHSISYNEAGHELTA